MAGRQVVFERLRDGRETQDAHHLDDRAETDDVRHARIAQLPGDAQDVIDDVLIYALFPQIGFKFLEHRGNPDVFEPAPVEPAPVGAAPAGEPEAVTASAASPRVPGAPEVYTVKVNGQSYVVEVAEGGDVSAIAPAPATAAAPVVAPGVSKALPAPLAGNIFVVKVAVGDSVAAGDVIVILEAMKMETEVRASQAGTVSAVNVKVGDSVSVGDALIMLD